MQTLPTSSLTLSARTRRFLGAAQVRAEAARTTVSPKQEQWTQAFFGLYKDEACRRRRQALACAYTLAQAPVLLFDDEQLVGMLYQTIPGSGTCDIGGAAFDPRWQPFDGSVHVYDRVRRELPDLLPLNGKPNGDWDTAAWVAGVHVCPGHIGWHYEWVMHDGFTGLLDRITAAVPSADAQGREELEGMRIMAEAALAWADRHVAALEARLPQLPADQQAECRRKLEICRRVPRHGARSFREAVQAYHLSYLATIFENPHGGNGPGRLDYHLWPYLERDLADGVETLASARELIDELFIRFHERLCFQADGWVETIVVGGCRPEDGGSAVSHLSRLMVESIGALKLSHPSVYIRVPEDAPDAWYEVAACDLREGGNRAQILSDAAIVRAITHRGDIAVEDARMYMCGGCMEVSPQGMNGDLLFCGFFNTPKILELVLNGGRCLNTGNQVLAHHTRTLAEFADFESLYAAFAAEVTRALHIVFRSMDIGSEEYARWRPRFLLSAQIEDCIARGRVINDGGARYEDYGSTPLGLPNLADSLYAIQRAVFDDAFVSAGDLLTALRANFQGHEALRARLLALPKFGQGHVGADGMVNRVVRTVCDAYDSYRNRFGRRIKPMVMSFVMGPIAGRALGAGADGRLAGTPIAQSLTPQNGAMTQGITTAVQSANAVDLHRFCAGVTSMWDMDPDCATAENLKSILKTFIETGGQMYQGNTTDVETLLKAKAAPEQYPHLMVRIGGFSGRFVACSPELQDEIIARRRHRQ